MSAELANPRRRAAGAASREEVVDEQIVDELRRHGPRTGAELLVAVGAPPSVVVDRAIVLVTTDVIRVVVTGGERRFTLRRRAR